MTVDRVPAGADLREVIYRLETALPDGWGWSLDVWSAAYVQASAHNVGFVRAEVEAPDIAQAIERLAEKVEAL